MVHQPLKTCHRWLGSGWKTLFAISLLALSACAPVFVEPDNPDPDLVFSTLGKKGSSEQALDARQLQQFVMALADDYATEISEIVYLQLKPAARTGQERILAQSFLRNSFGAAADIAAGPNPVVSLLDMLILVTLQEHVFATHWVPDYWGEERGQQAMSRIARLKERIWARSSPLLSDRQREQLQSLIQSWLQENPDRIVVELIRFSEFTNARIPGRSDNRAVAIGLLTELNEAVSTINDAVLFGERALWYSGRMSYILGEQAELTAYRMLDTPEIRLALQQVESYQGTLDGILGEINSIPEEIRTERIAVFESLRRERIAAIESLNRELNKTLTTSLDGIIQTVKAERQEIIASFFDRLAFERQTVLGELNTETGSLGSVLPEINEIVQRSTELARLTSDTMYLVDQLADRFGVAPENGTQSDDEERDALLDALELARATTTMLDQTNHLIDSPKLESHVTLAENLSHSLIDKIFWRLAILIAMVFAGILLIKMLPSKRSG